MRCAVVDPNTGAVVNVIVAEMRAEAISRGGKDVKGGRDG